MAAEARLTIVILAHNEARHLARCIASVGHLGARIVVVDSGSTDDSTAIAETSGARVLRHGWTNYAQQFNWALDQIGPATAGTWLMRLDADEVISPRLAASLADFFANPPSDPAISGVTIDRCIHFLGRRIRWGGMYPTRVIRVWRAGRGRVENRWMDEHVVVDGKVMHLRGDIADINLNSIGWWITKHNGYATREAIDQLQLDTAAAITGNMGQHARRKRWMKDNLYARLPLGLRPLLYFLYRYVVRLGFLDGWQGLAFHGLQGLWYRFLVDAKIAEIRSLMRVRGHDLARVIADEYGMIV